MTGVELSALICLRCDFCESFGCFHNDGLPCFKCLHDLAWEMYVLGLDMLETGLNPLI